MACGQLVVPREQSELLMEPTEQLMRHDTLLPTEIRSILHDATSANIEARATPHHIA